MPETMDRQRLALIAAEAATSASAELLRFAREGDGWNRPFGLENPLEQLVEAVRKTAEIEYDFLDQIPGLDDERSSTGQLIAAVAKWQSDVGAI